LSFWAWGFALTPTLCSYAYTLLLPAKLKRTQRSEISMRYQRLPSVLSFDSKVVECTLKLFKALPEAKFKDNKFLKKGRILWDKRRILWVLDLGLRKNIEVNGSQNQKVIHNIFTKINLFASFYNNN
jgi:hypothetical protein